VAEASRRTSFVRNESQRDATPPPLIVTTLQGVVVPRLVNLDTMAEEPTQAPPVGDDRKPGNYRNGGGRPQRKRDETPIEDLFDLSKPIPRVRDDDWRLELVFLDFLTLYDIYCSCYDVYRWKSPTRMRSRRHWPS
jgi:hypothetical protein